MTGLKPGYRPSFRSRLRRSVRTLRLELGSLLVPTRARVCWWVLRERGVVYGLYLTEQPTLPTQGGPVLFASNTIGDVYQDSGVVEVMGHSPVLPQVTDSVIQVELSEPVTPDRPLGTILDEHLSAGRVSIRGCTVVVGDDSVRVEPFFEPASIPQGDA